MGSATRPGRRPCTLADPSRDLRDGPGRGGGIAQWRQRVVSAWTPAPLVSRHPPPRPATPRGSVPRLPSRPRSVDPYPTCTLPALPQSCETHPAGRAWPLGLGRSRLHTTRTTPLAPALRQPGSQPLSPSHRRRPAAPDRLAGTARSAAASPGRRTCVAGPRRPRPGRQRQR